MFRPIVATEEKQLATITQTGPVGGASPTGPSPDAVALKERDHRRYEFIEEHGRGGLGRVMRTRDLDLGREVAIKEILDSGGMAEARFVREAMITARLEHPGIVPVHDAGRWPDGTPFYAMKLVSGRPLKDLLREANSLEDRLALLPHLIAVADAIAYAHDREIIHRDLKPSNIIVGDFGETVVIDWGLAKDLKNSDKEHSTSGLCQPSEDSTLTMAGAVIGTPAYMPPEQARGEDVGASADVYALGAILYHLLSGRPPYKGASSGEVVAQVLTTPPDALEDLAPGIPRDLIAVANKALARSLDERYRSAGEFVEDLRRFQTGQLVSAHEYSTPDLLFRWLRKHVLLVVAGAILISGLAVAAYITITRVMTARAEVTERERRLSVSQSALEQRTESLHLAEIARHVVEDPTSIIATVAAALGSRNELNPALFGLIRRADVLGIARWTESSHGNVSLAFSPPDKVALVDSRSVRVLSLATGVALIHASFDSPLGVWQSAWASPDVLAIARVDGSVWRLDSSGRLENLSNTGSPDGAMAAVRAGSPLAAAANGKNVVMLDVLDGRTLGSLSTTGIPKLIAVDERTTASIDADGLLTVRSNGATESRCRMDSSEWILIDLDTRGGVVALADDEGSLTIVEYATCTRVAAMQHVVRQPVFLKLVAASPATEVIISGKDNVTVVWNRSDGTRLFRGWTAAYDEAHSWLATGDTTGHVVIQSLKADWSRTIEAHTTFIVDMVFGSAGQLVTASSDGTVRAWDATILPDIASLRSPVRNIRSQPCSRDYAVLSNGHIVPLPAAKATPEIDAMDIDCGPHGDKTLAGPSPGTTPLTQVHRHGAFWVATTSNGLFWRLDGDGDEKWQAWPVRLEASEQLGYVSDTSTGIVIGTTNGRVIGWTLGAPDAHIWKVARDNDLVLRVIPLTSGYAALLNTGALLLIWGPFVTSVESKCVMALVPKDGHEFLVSCNDRLRVYDETLHLKGEYPFDARIEKVWWSNGVALVLAGDNLSVLDLRTGAMKLLPVRVAVRDAAVRRSAEKLIVYVASRQTVQTWNVSLADVLGQGNIQEWVQQHSQATVTTGR